jgi:hypothetical protein
MSRKKLEYMKGAGNMLDIQIFQQLPLYIRHRVLKEGRFIITKDRDKLYDQAVLTAKELEDFRPLYMRYLEAVKNG